MMTFNQVCSEFEDVILSSLTANQIAQVCHRHTVTESQLRLFKMFMLFKMENGELDMMAELNLNELTSEARARGVVEDLEHLQMAAMDCFELEITAAVLA